MTRLPIVVSGWGRTVALARAAVAVLFMVSFLVFAFAEDVEGMTESDDAVRLATGLALAPACAWVAWLLVRPALVRRSYIELTPDKLMVVHPGLLKRPLEVPRSLIKAAAVDPRPWRWRWLGNKGRFHLGGPAVPGTASAPPAVSPEWLFSVNGGSPFPILSTVDDVPNVAFLFSEAIRMVSVRRGTRPFATMGPVHVLVYGRAARGLLVKVKDPAAAEQALSQWTTVRPVTVSDVVTIEAHPEYARSAKKHRRTANVWLGIVLLLLVGGPVLSTLAERADSSLWP